MSAATSGARSLREALERHLSSAETEILLEPEGDEATAVTIISRQKLRGLSRLGDPMMRGAGRRLVDEALQNLAAALEPAG